MAEGGQEQKQNSGRDRRLDLLILLVAGVVLVLFGRAVFSLLASASPEVFAAVVLTSGTILVSVGSLILSNRYQVRQQIQQAQRERKSQVYEEMLEYWFWVMRERGETSEDERKQRDEAYHSTVPQKLITWASEPVLKGYASTLGPYEEGEDTSIFDFEKLILTIRRDLGHTNKGLEDGDLLKQFLTGVDEALEARRQAP
jgi:hypothetical protein